MKVRKPAAPHFYAGDCARATDRFLRGFSPAKQPERIVAGIVPHAGWDYSGALAAVVFENIRQRGCPTTFVFFGTAHRWTGGNAVYARGAWATPLGEIAVDEELAAEILRETNGLAGENPSAHDGEHAIEVELPFVKYLFPDAKVVPISVSPEETAVRFGRRVGEVIKNAARPITIIGSTDLTHYGDVYGFTPAGYGSRAREWMKENDGRILQLAERMDAARIVPEVRDHQNACGPGAMAATVAAASVLGAERGYLLDYTTSFDVAPDEEDGGEDAEFRMAVGYAGILY
ncbi:MAG: AmmeMemoRadiSam system protein B [Acidobacteria bacterium]|nr:AmmeMemoRadiSam system protein B [Acidobacteriota bacterium]